MTVGLFLRGAQFPLSLFSFFFSFLFYHPPFYLLKTKLCTCVLILYFSLITSVFPRRKRSANADFWDFKSMMLAMLTAGLFMCAGAFSEPAASYQHRFEKTESRGTVRSAVRGKKSHKRATKGKRNYCTTVNLGTDTEF